MVALSPRVGRLRAGNPSPMTLDGTNGYVVRVGERRLVAIDPGPLDPVQCEAFLATAREANMTYAAILVTHGHPDHAPGAAALHAATGAAVFAHPSAQFPHDVTLADRERLTFAETAFTVLHAPGHARDHVIFVLEDERALFTGDVVLGEGTVVVAPPGGDMRAYQATLHRLRDEYGDAAAIYGGHGPERRDVRDVLDFYIAHREQRESQIIDVLRRGASTLPGIVHVVYRDVDERLWPAAARQVLAYLLALESESVVGSHVLERAPTAEEAALLNPDLSRLGQGIGADVIRAELGFGIAEPLLEYCIVST